MMTSIPRSLSSNETLRPRWKDDNFETYSLVWLDASISSEENLAAQDVLRSSISYLQAFDQLEACEKHIRSVCSDDRVVFIVSGPFGQQIVPQVSLLQQVSSIYIYCANKQVHEAWSKQYQKVKGVHDRLNELIKQIESDQSRGRQHKLDEPLSILIFNPKSGYEQSTTGLDGRFVQSQLLISCLLKMEAAPSDRQEFISHCREFYRGNNKQLKDVDEFEKDYDPEHSLWWYSTDKFLYRFLNKALRILNIDLLFLMRFFIRDVEQQLHQRRHPSPIHVYRGQLMSIDELKLLENSINKLISTNSFLSTTMDRAVAHMYLDPSTKDQTLEKVLFEIDADPCQLGVKPFADLSGISQFSQEKEILMTVGSVFRLKEIVRDENEVWHIKLILCSDNDCDLQAVVRHMSNQYGPMNTRFLWFADVLIGMANFTDAKKYLCRLLKQLPPHHRDVPKCYHALAKICCEEGNYGSSHSYLHRALEYLRKFQPNDSQMGYMYNSIGEVYQNQGDFKRALESYGKALDIFRRTITQNDETVAWCYNNLGIIYEKQKDYPNALCYLSKALHIKEKLLPPEHPCLSNTYNNIGNVHYHHQEYDQALAKYQFSYEIFRKSLTAQHPSIARVLRNIGLVYEAKNDLIQAKRNYDKAFDIRACILSSSHPDLIEIKEDIARVSSKFE